MGCERRAPRRKTWVGRVYVLPILLFSILLPGGCASTVSDVIRHAPVQAVSVQQAREAPEVHRGNRVRWGGSIVAVENRRDATWVELLSRPLDGSHKPDPDQPAGGRFLARMDGFIDPAEFAPDRLLTVVGRLAGSREQLIGEYSYRYAVIEVQAHHLWPIPVEPRYYPAYPWYDPWFDPWYRPWPYRRYW